jgi:hypothetical protein
MSLWQLWGRTLQVRVTVARHVALDGHLALQAQTTFQVSSKLRAAKGAGVVRTPEAKLSGDPKKTQVSQNTPRRRPIGCQTMWIYPTLDQ